MEEVPCHSRDRVIVVMVGSFHDGVLFFCVYRKRVTARARRKLLEGAP